MAVTIKNINDAYVYQLYNPQDENLIKSVYISRNFGQPEDYVEYNIFDSKGILLTTTYDVDTFRTVDPDPETNLYTTIKFDPEFDVKSEGFTTGKVQITYNVFRICSFIFSRQSFISTTLFCISKWLLLLPSVFISLPTS